MTFMKTRFTIHSKFLATLFLALSFLLTQQNAAAQCANNNIQFSSSSATSWVNGVFNTLTTCLFGGEYRLVTGIVAGNTYTFSTCGDTDFDTQITIYTEAGVFVAFNDDFCGLQSQVTFVAPSSGSYRVLIDQYNCADNSTCMTLLGMLGIPTPPPANDLCSGAIAITCGVPVIGSTANATNDIAPSCGTTDGSKGVWYTITGTGFPISLTLCNATTNYDTKLRVYSGSCASLVCVAGNDDIGSACSFSTLLSAVTFNSVNGTTYFILVHGFSTASGNFSLESTCVDPCNPDNTDPSVTCIGGSVSVELGPEGAYTFEGNELVASASDACGDVDITYSPATVSCATLGTQVINVVATDESGNTAACAKTVTVAAGGDLPSEWSIDEIGAASGNAAYPSCGEPTYIVSTNGSTSPSADGLLFVNQSLCGDGSITVKVESVTPQGWAGVMMRESGANGSKKVGLKTKLTTSLGREIRSTTNGSSSLSLIPVPPGRKWLRLSRSGNTFTGHSSPNGSTWFFAFSINITMNSCIQVGMYAESYNPVNVTTAVFSSVSTTGTQIPVRPAGDIIANAPQVDIFPNPTRDEININLTGFQGQATNLRLLNGLGQELMVRNMGEVENTTEVFSLNNLPKGVYYLRVESVLEQRVFKVVKE